MPKVIKEATRRTGVPGLDVYGVIISVASIVVLLFFSHLYLPLGIVSLIAFVSLVRLPPELRPLGRIREVRPVPIEPEGETEERSYEWKFPAGFEEHSEFMNLKLSKARYKNLREKNPSRNRQPNPDDLSEFVGSGITPEIYQAVNHFSDTTNNYSLSGYDEVTNALCFAQESIEYAYDKDSVGIEDYWRYPLETLYDKQGDCECKSIMVAAILKALGYDVLFLIISSKDKTKPSHAAIAVAGADGFPDFKGYNYKGKVYFYCETTAEGWKVGEIPREYSDAEIGAFNV
ncbi:hypothetical protein KAW65_07625 [candidate division WOR-3 bacterium]|nr:hypothetical protein [candidate division WOR-3 bacterium]